MYNQDGRLRRSNTTHRTDCTVGSQIQNELDENFIVMINRIRSPVPLGAWVCFTPKSAQGLPNHHCTFPTVPCCKLFPSWLPV